MKKILLLIGLLVLGLGLPDAQAEDVENSSTALLGEKAPVPKTPTLETRVETKTQSCIRGPNEYLDEFKKLEKQYFSALEPGAKAKIRREIALMILNSGHNRAILAEGGWISEIPLCENWSFGARTSADGKTVTVFLTDNNGVKSKFTFPLS